MISDGLGEELELDELDEELDDEEEEEEDDTKRYVRQNSPRLFGLYATFLDNLDGLLSCLHICLTSPTVSNCLSNGSIAASRPEPVLRAEGVDPVAPFVTTGPKPISRVEPAELVAPFPFVVAAVVVVVVVVVVAAAEDDDEDVEPGDEPKTKTTASSGAEEEKNVGEDDEEEKSVGEDDEEQEEDDGSSEVTESVQLEEEGRGEGWETVEELGQSQTREGLEGGRKPGRL